MVNLDLFFEIEQQLLDVIKLSFIDNGKKVDDDFNIGVLRGLNRCDSENELITGASADVGKVSEWQANQQCICYNLPALALFLNERSFMQVLFPHLQSLAGNQYINPKLSLVLPQTCLCLRADASRAKLLELIYHITSIALNDNDYNLIKSIMQDMHMLFKVFGAGQLEERAQYSLGITL